MSGQTKIKWPWRALSTASPWTGCRKRGPSCDHCYAEAMAARMGWVKKGEWGKTYHRFKNFEKTARALNRRPWVCDECGNAVARNQNHCWECQCASHHRRRIFPSQCDWLDPNVPPEWQLEFLRVVHECDQIEWLLLTKYPEGWPNVRNNFRKVLSQSGNLRLQLAVRPLLNVWLSGEQPKNVTPGLSAGTQAELDARIESFLRIPAKRRFLSLEPLLQKIHIMPALVNSNRSNINAVIVGGESDTPLAKARPCDIDDVRDVIRQCRQAGVRCWVKQLGSFAIEMILPRPEMEARVLFRLQLNDPKGGDPDEWPEDLRVRDKL